jgi:hypothetical protein
MITLKVNAIQVVRSNSVCKTGFKCNDAAGEDLRGQKLHGGLTSGYSMEGDECHKKEKERKIMTPNAEERSRDENEQKKMKLKGQGSNREPINRFNLYPGPVCVVWRKLNTS